MDFEKQKKRQLSKKDKSSIGNWDKKIKSLCNKINKKSFYYTTSSCAGRIILLKSKDKKIKNAFIFRTHEKTTLKELKNALKKTKYNKIIEFQQTTCILHVACKNLESAQQIVNKAKLAGWKRSGIMTTKKRIITELHSTESISFPIINKKEFLVDEKFLKLVIKQANKKLEKTWEKIEKLKKLV